MVNVTSYLPSAELRDIVKHYWIMRIDDSSDYREEFFFPVGAVEIIFHFKTPFTRNINGEFIFEKKAFIEGQQSGIIKVKSAGEMKTVGITLYPWATSLLFNMAPVLFNDKSFAAEKIDENLPALYDQLHSNTDDKLIPGFCNQYISAHLKNKFVHYTPAELDIINIFKKQNKDYNIGDLKKDWGYSTKLFEKTFKEMTGLSAGELMKKRRIARVLKNVFLQDYKSLTDVAYAAGYYDQSHFIKDFKTYFLSSPKLLKKDHSLLKHFI